MDIRAHLSNARTDSSTRRSSHLPYPDLSLVKINLTLVNLTLVNQTLVNLILVNLTLVDLTSALTSPNKWWQLMISSVQNTS